MATGSPGGYPADETTNNTSTDEELDEEIKKVITDVLDELVSANSIFTMAVFLGLSFATPNQQGLESRPECSADTNMAKRLVVYEVVSFACFLLSNLVARSMKVYIHIFEINKKKKPEVGNGTKKVRIDCIKGSMFFVSIMSSLAGVVLLVASMVCVVEIKLGKLYCGSPYARTAVISLLMLVVLACALYLLMMLCANLFVLVGRVTLKKSKNAGDANNGKSQGCF